MKKSIFFLVCFFAISVVAAQNSLKNKRKNCEKDRSCTKNYKSRCAASLDEDNAANYHLASKKWRINAVGLNIGVFSDNYNNMTVEGMKSMAIQVPNQPINLNGMTQMEGANEVMIEGTTIGGYISLNPRTRRQDGYNTNQELRIGLNANIEREAMIQYLDDASASSSYNSVIYCLIENELVLSATYLFNKKLGRRFGVYGGAGVNAGTTFNNLFLVIEDRYDNNNGFESNTTTVDARSSYYTRGFLNVGLRYYTLGKVSFHLDMQSGVGMQIVNGAENNFISNSCVGQLGVQYQFLR